VDATTDRRAGSAARTSCCSPKGLACRPPDIAPPLPASPRNCAGARIVADRAGAFEQHRFVCGRRRTNSQKNGITACCLRRAGLRAGGVEAHWARLPPSQKRLRGVRQASTIYARGHCGDFDSGSPRAVFGDRGGLSIRATRAWSLHNAGQNGVGGGVGRRFAPDGGDLRRVMS